MIFVCIEVCEKYLDSKKIWSENMFSVQKNEN